MDPGAMAAEPSGPAWERLEQRLEWYDEHSGHHRRWFVSLKVTQIVVAAAIPATAAAGGSAAVAGVLGAVVVVLEGIQQLFQFQQNWVAYRGAAEALERERALFLAGAGPYAVATGPREALLAERVESLIASEHSGWAAVRSEKPSSGAATLSS
jgi:uncharacterized protein DUF4231